MVDAHQHFWDPFINHHPWLAKDRLIPFRYGDYSAIKRVYMPTDYLTDAAGHDVRQTVYIETEWDSSDPVGETRYATSLHRRFGYPNAIVAQAWLDRPDVDEVLAGHAGFALVRSVRHKPGGPEAPDQAGRTRSLMSDEGWRRGFSLLERHGLHFDLQTPWWNFPEAIALARDFPRTTIILNHTGLPSDRTSEGLQHWHRAMASLAEAPNVVVKISGIGQKGVPWTVEGNRWIVRETIAMFGAARCMFASNFPVDSLCATLDTIFSGFKRMVADLPSADQERLFAATAQAVYRPVAPGSSQAG
jgi:predicted TIM-barrel fold metal-dependent hydrolase